MHLKRFSFSANISIGLIVTHPRRPIIQVLTDILEVTESTGLFLSNVCNLTADHSETGIWIVVRPGPKGNNVSDRDGGSPIEHLNANGVENSTRELGERIKAKTNLDFTKIDAGKIWSQSALIARSKAVVFRRIWPRCWYGFLRKS